MTKYTELANVTKIMLEQDLARHRVNVEESRRVAGELAQIDAMRAAAQADVGAIGARQLLGADTLWQGWMVQKRAEIQRRAAMARARELDTLSRAKRAFSRAEATRALVEADRLDRKRRQDQAAAETMEDLGRLRAAMKAQDTP